MSDQKPCQLTITTAARDDLKRLDKVTAERVLKKMIGVAENATGADHVALRDE